MAITADEPQEPWVFKEARLEEAQGPWRCTSRRESGALSRFARQHRFEVEAGLSRCRDLRAAKEIGRLSMAPSRVF